MTVIDEAAVKALVGKAQLDLEHQIRDLKLSIRDQGIKLDRFAETVTDLSDVMYGTKEPIVRLGVYHMTEQLFRERQELRTVSRYILPILVGLQALSFLGVDLNRIIQALAGVFAGVSP